MLRWLSETDAYVGTSKSINIPNYSVASTAGGSVPSLPVAVGSREIEESQGDGDV
ncbi:hypothetical protein FOA52_004323 [Chlamydomonas sp. UWO 241]|nr:hypothetical protein FOA52_004323 [Chlamydomonas sp. UWO 241]